MPRRVLEGGAQPSLEADPAAFRFRGRLRPRPASRVEAAFV